jgi:UDP-N-acetylenolpyruvoylglucosamine reductase
MASVVASVTALDYTTLTTSHIDAADISFTYRSAAFGDRPRGAVFIADVQLHLSLDPTTSGRARENLSR